MAEDPWSATAPLSIEQQMVWFEKGGDGGNDNLAGEWMNLLRSTLEKISKTPILPISLDNH